MKRFTDTEKWMKDKWFFDLSPEHKMFWLYLLDTCDNVGVWEVNIELAGIIIGYQYSMDTLWKEFECKVHRFADNSKWWIRTFIDFQHGRLDPKSHSKPIQSYILLLQKHSLWEVYEEGMDTLQGKGKGNGRERVKVRDQEEVGARAERFREAMLQFYIDPMPDAKKAVECVRLCHSSFASVSEMGITNALKLAPDRSKWGESIEALQKRFDGKDAISSPLGALERFMKGKVIEGQGKWD